MKRFLSIVLSIQLCFLLCGCNRVAYRVTDEEIGTTFEEDLEDMQIVADGLVGIEGESARVWDDHLTVNAHGEITQLELASMEDTVLRDTILQLRDKGYDTIAKRGGTVYFGRWEDSFSWRSGFAFSADHTGDLDIQFLVAQRELDKTDWFYYEEDYNSWREEQ